MASNCGLTTACRTIADSTGLLAIVILSFDLVNPDPVKNGSIGRRATGCAKHALSSIAVKLLSFRFKPVGPAWLCLKAASSKTMSNSSAWRERMSGTQGVIVGTNVTELIKVQEWEAGRRQGVNCIIKGKAEVDNRSSAVISVRVSEMGNDTNKCGMIRNVDIIEGQNVGVFKTSAPARDTRDGCTSKQVSDLEALAG